MDILKNKVKELETQTDHEAIVKSLQEIGKLLLTDYVVQVDDVTVEPVSYTHLNHSSCSTRSK